MALCLRHISTRFASLKPYITPRNHVIKHQRSASLVSNKLDYVEQYSPQPSRHKVVSLNRECLGDVVEKINVNNYKEMSRLSSHQHVAEHNKGILLYSDDSTPENSPNRPDPEKLSRVFDVLRTGIPRFFTQTMDYTIYHPEIVFENNIRGVTTVGIFKYVKQMALIRTVGHIKFGFVTAEVLKITKHPEDNTIKIRWQIRGIGGFRIFVNFWKYKLWDYRNMLATKPEVWIDGFSTFYVNADGLVYRHVADRMMPDDDKVAVPADSMTGPKLAGIGG